MIGGKVGGFPGEMPCLSTRTCIVQFLDVPQLFSGRHGPIRAEDGLLGFGSIFIEAMNLESTSGAK